MDGSRGVPIQPFNEHEKFHIENEYNVHMSSENYNEKNDHMLYLDLLTILY